MCVCVCVRERESAISPYTQLPFLYFQTSPGQLLIQNVLSHLLVKINIQVVPKVKRNYNSQQQRASLNKNTHQPTCYCRLWWVQSHHRETKSTVRRPPSESQGSEKNGHHSNQCDMMYTKLAKFLPLTFFYLMQNEEYLYIKIVHPYSHTVI